MRIRKSTIVWFVLAVLVAASQIISVEDPDAISWSDAVFVEDAKVLPENEGKLVAVSGKPVMLEPATDEQVGVSFASPRVYRSAYALKYSPLLKSWDTGYTFDGDELASGVLTGRVAIGEYELDKELLKKLDSVGGKEINEKDFSKEDLAYMRKTGSLITWGGKFCYAEIKDKANANYAWNNPEELDAFDYRLHPEWDGSHMVNWTQWEIKPDDEITVVGIQKGNTLTYCEGMAAGDVSKNRVVTEDEVQGPENPILVKCMGLLIAALFAFLGVRSMGKKNT